MGVCIDVDIDIDIDVRMYVYVYIYIYIYIIHDKKNNNASKDSAMEHRLRW